MFECKYVAVVCIPISISIATNFNTLLHSKHLWLSNVAPLMETASAPLMKGVLALLYCENMLVERLEKVLYVVDFVSKSATF